MCLLISVEAAHDSRERLVTAARAAAARGIRVDVSHPSRWPGARSRAIVGRVTEDGSCSCSMLADDADWNARTWTFRAEVLPALESTLRVLIELGPLPLRIAALWGGEQPAVVVRLSADQFLSQLRCEGLETSTAYLVEGWS